MYPIVEKVELSSKPINARFEAYCLSASVKVQSFRLEKGAPANTTFGKKVAQNVRSCQFGARELCCCCTSTRTHTNNLCGLPTKLEFSCCVCRR